MAIVIPGKIVYLGIPHTASAATHKALITLPDAIITGQHDRLKDVEDRGLTEGDEVVFTVIRNPYDLCATWYIRSDPQMTIFEFLSMWDQKPQITDGRIYSFVDDCDEILRYESLQEDIDDLLERVDLPSVDIVLENKTKKKTKPWIEYYDQKTIEVVNERFGEEFKEYYEMITL